MKARIFVAATLTACCCQLTGCSSLEGLKNGAAITKVNKYHLDLSNDTKSSAADKLIINERKRRLHGAITSDEEEAREGFYFTVFWKTENPSLPATVRLEYLLQSTNDTVHMQEVSIPGGRKSHVTEFSVVGDEYAEHGEVLAYRISVDQEDRTVADHQSYLWE